MCRFISFWHNPLNGDIAVNDLNSHSNTLDNLKLTNGIWREGHYLPDGTIECRVEGKDRISMIDCNERLKQKYPTFIDFANYAFSQPSVNIGTSLYLSSLTSAEGLVIPAEVTYLYLSSLTSAEGLVIPAVVTYLDLSSLTSAEGLVIPAGVTSLDLSSLTSAKGLVIPAGVTYLYLSSLK